MSISLLFLRRKCASKHKNIFHNDEINAGKINILVAKYNIVVRSNAGMIEIPVTLYK